MKYETYSFLRSCLEQQSEKLIDEFRLSHKFTEKVSHKGKESICDSLREKLSVVTEMKRDLEKTVKFFYKKHPNPEMRRFWNVDDEN